MTSSYTILLLFHVQIHSIIFVSQDLVVLYIKDMLHSEPLLHLTNSGFTDSVWAPIKSKGGTSIIGVCYKSTSSTDPNNVKLLQLLEEATQQPHRHIIILWNSNYPSIEYSKLIVNPGGEQAAKDFLDKTMDIFLYQNVYEDTRVRRGQNPSKLDYIFTDEDNLIKNLHSAGITATWKKWPCLLWFFISKKERGWSA